MRELDLTEIEQIEGGSCLWSSVSLAATFAGAFLVAGPIGAGIFAAGFISGSISLAYSC